MRILLCCLFALLLSACETKKDPTEIWVGTMTGSDAQLMEVVQNVALQKYGLHVKIIQFTDYSKPNEALMNGDIDINVFQHQPYLIAWNASHNGNLIPAAKSFIFPMGIYSYKVDRIDELNKGSVIIIPGDPTNQARALLLLQHAGLIALRPGADVLATPADIISNPRNLSIRPFSAAQLASMLPDVDAAVINSNYALLAGLIPKRGDMTPTRKDAIYIEDKDGLYANVIVARPKEKNDPDIQKFIEAFQSPQVWAAAQSLFQGSAIKAW
jgi:D-methionine transport system substrate-binding protein